MATLKYTYFFPDIVGLELNGVKLRMDHALIFGFWRARENMSGWDSNENNEKSAEALCLDVRDYKNKRSELIKAGLLTIERGLKNSVKKVHTVDDDTVFSFIQSMTVNRSVSLHNDSPSLHNETETGVATPIRNNNSNKLTGPSLADANSGPGNQLDDRANFSSLSGSERSERGEAQGSGEKGRLTNDPFDAPVKNEVLSLKPEKKGQSAEDVRAWAITNKVTKIVREAGYPCPDGNIALHSAIKARLKQKIDGRDISEEMILKVAKEYITTNDKFYSPSNMSVQKAFSNENFYKYLSMGNGGVRPAESIFGRN